MHKTFLAVRNALNGLRMAFKNERNFRIEICCACIALVMAILLKLNQVSWLIIVLNICLVLTAELLNTAIESLADLACKEINPVIKIIKDVSAAAVLLTALTAVVCALIIFIPAIFKILHA